MAASEKSRGFTFHGEGGTLFGIHIVNLFLSLITFGIYSFWARVKVRKYIWGQLEFEDDRLSYHGTGEETIKGWFKALLIFGIPYLLVTHGPKWMGADKMWIILGAMLSIPMFVIFIPMAVVGSRRYRLSRSAWREIRFSFQETWKNYLPIAIKGNILTVITLGLYAPYFGVTRDKFLVSNSYLGNRKFDYDGNGGDLFATYLVCFLLAIPTLGFSIFWYYVFKHRYLWNHTTFGDARFNCTITFGGMFKVAFVNGLLTLITLGFYYPWAEVRSINYLLANLTLDGSAALGSIKQDAQTVNATGEELASFLDLDFDLG